VLIRDYANRDGVVLRFPAAVWSAFLAHARSKDVGLRQVAVVDGSVLIRDYANRDGVVLRFPAAVWSAFLAHARSKDVGLR